MRQRFLVVGADQSSKKEMLLAEAQFQAFRFEQLVNLLCTNNYQILIITWVAAVGALAVVIISARGVNLPMLCSVALFLVNNVLIAWAYKDGGRHMKTVQFIVQFSVGVAPLFPPVFLAYETSQSGGRGLDINLAQIIIIAMFPIFGSLFARMSSQAVLATRLPQLVILSCVWLWSPTLEEKPAYQLQALTTVVFIWSMLLTLVFILENMERKLYHSQLREKAKNSVPPVYDSTSLYVSTSTNNPCSPRCWPEDGYPAPGSPSLPDLSDASSKDSLDPLSIDLLAGTSVRSHIRQTPAFAAGTRRPSLRIRPLVATPLQCATLESSGQPRRRPEEAKIDTTSLCNQETPLTGSYNSFGEVYHRSLTERNVKLHNKRCKQEQQNREMALQDAQCALPKSPSEGNTMIFEMEC
jgi:hypothetical protein